MGRWRNYAAGRPWLAAGEKGCCVRRGSALRHWIGALRGAVDPLPSAETALLTMLVSEGIYLSEKLRREVTADEIASMSKSTAAKL